MPPLPALLPEAARLMQMEREVQVEFRPMMLRALEQRVRDAARLVEETPPVCAQCRRAMTKRGGWSRRLLTLFGELTLEGRGFRCKTCETTTMPLQEWLGLEAGHLSGAVSRLVALLGVVAPYALAAKLVDILLGIEIDEMAVWREVQRLGLAWNTHEMGLSRFHGDARNATSPCDTAPAAVVLETDGAALGMQKDTRRKRGEGATPGEVGVAPREPSEFREVKTGVLLLPSERVHKGERRSVLRRVLVSCLGDADEIYARLWAKLCDLGWVGPNTIFVIIGDGAEWIWNRVTLFERRCEILDFWHAVERAWEFARLQFGEESKRATDWAHSLAGQLRRGEVQTVIAQLQALVPSRPEAAESLEKLIKYYSDNVNRMRYDEYLRAGWGIGSGAVESAHKQVLQARMRQAGMRWTEKGARHVLALRVLLLNGQWDRLDFVRRSSLAA